MRFCSACRMSGRRASNCDGIPAGTSGRTKSSRDLPRGMGPGFRPRSTSRASSCSAINCSNSGTAAAAASYSDSTCRSSSSEMSPLSKRSLKRSTESLAAACRPFRDIELLVQVAQVRVGDGHRRHDREHDARPALFRREQVGPGRLCRPAELSPEIDLPGRADISLEIAVRIYRRRGPGGIRVPRDASIRCPRPPAPTCGKSGALRRAEASQELVNPRGGNLYVVVLVQGALYQAVQNRVLELFPPERVDHLPGLPLLKPPRRRRLDGRAPIIGTHHAAGEGDREQ